MKRYAIMGKDKTGNYINIFKSSLTYSHLKSAERAFERFDFKDEAEPMIRMVEVITDTERLEFMISVNDVLFHTESGYWWKSGFSDDKTPCFKTARDAIDAAMRGET